MDKFLETLYGLGRRKGQQPKSCLLCGKPSWRPWCSAEHKREWQTRNPGNGRYPLFKHWRKGDQGKVILDQWTIIPMTKYAAQLIGCSGKKNWKQLYYIQNPDRQIIKRYFDCVIDAQRHVEKTVLDQALPVT